MASLKDLEATFLKHNSDGSSSLVKTLAEADGILFLCPKCFQTNGGNAGTHSVICWFVGKVPDNLDPKPGRWQPTGTDLDDLSFVPSPGHSPSVLLTAGCHWHGFIKNGSAD